LILAYSEIFLIMDYLTGQTGHLIPRSGSVLLVCFTACRFLSWRHMASMLDFFESYFLSIVFTNLTFDFVVSIVFDRLDMSTNELM
jgi:hypothetical protein